MLQIPTPLPFIYKASRRFYLIKKHRAKMIAHSIPYHLHRSRRILTKNPKSHSRNFHQPSHPPVLYSMFLSSTFLSGTKLHALWWCISAWKLLSSLV